MKGEKCMKTRNSLLLLVVTLGVVACSDNFLTKETYGGNITETQYQRLSSQLEGSLRGIYSMLYAYGGHDEFGERSIDMYTDLLSSDMALTSYTYGWFAYDERGLSRTARTGYVWFYYYQMLRNVNMVINISNSQSGVLSRIAEKGLPTNYTASSEVYYRIDGTDTTRYTGEEAAIAYYYAQALTMRGYIYSNLLQLYTRTTAELGTLEGDAFPLYNENNFEEPQPIAQIQEVYTQIESDLETAIRYFEAFEAGMVRSSKLMVDASVAHGILAYSYLNKANPNAPTTGDVYRQTYGNALAHAKAVIESNKYSILSNAEVWTDGFNDVNSSNWMWGQEVTTETATGLASFFGQVDIHSYSYAWAGDTKAIDENLFKLITEKHSFDARQRWFNATAPFKYCPARKFFSAKNPTSTKDEDIDREWLSDNVFMRIESMYLIAAEASYRLGEDDDAISYLTAITDQRVDTAANAAADYATYIGGLNHENLLAEIDYNWRVEMWGEGYALQTLRRLGPSTIGDDKRRRGSNHKADAGSEISPTADKYVFQIPSSEYSYNPNVDGKELDE